MTVGVVGSFDIIVKRLLYVPAVLGLKSISIFSELFGEMENGISALVKKASLSPSIDVMCSAATL